MLTQATKLCITLDDSLQFIISDKVRQLEDEMRCLFKIRQFYIEKYAMGEQYIETFNSKKKEFMPFYNL